MAGAAMTERRRPEAPPRARLFRRALIMLDASLASTEALRAALTLLRDGDVELRGLYVEDRDLLRSAGLPFTREVGAYTGVARPLASDTLEARLQDRAQLVRAAIRRALAHERREVALQVLRDRVVAAALSEARDSDLLVLGRTGWASGRARSLGSNARQLIHLAPCSLLLGTWPERAVTGIVVRADEHAEQALGAALRVGGDGREYTLLVLPPETGELKDQRLAEITDWLETRGVSARLRVVYPPDENGLLKALLQEQIGALLISRTQDGSEEERGMITRLLERVDLPFLLLRAGAVDQPAEEAAGAPRASG